MTQDVKNKIAKAYQLVNKGVVIISRILSICLLIAFSWYAGQIICFGFITILQKLGLDDNLFRFLDSVSLF